MKNLDEIVKLPCYLIFDKSCKYNRHYKSLLENLGFSKIFEIHSTDKSFYDLYLDLCKSLKTGMGDSHAIILKCPFILHSQIIQIIYNLKLEVNDFDCLYLGGIFPLSKYKSRYFSNIDHVRLFNSNPDFCSDISLINSSGFIISQFFINQLELENPDSYIKNTDHLHFDALYRIDTLKVGSLISNNNSAKNRNKFFLIDNNTCGVIYQTKNPSTSKSPASKEFFINKNLNDWIEFEKEEVFRYSASPVSDNLFFSPRLTIPSNGVLKIKNGIISPRGLVLTNNLNPINELNCIGPKQFRENRTSSFYYKIYSEEIINKPTHFGGKCLIIKSLIDSNYGHNLLTEVPKVEIINKLAIDINQFDHIVLPNKKFKHLERIINYLNIDKSKILELQPNALHLFTEVYAPTPRGIGGIIFRKNNFNFLNDLFKLQQNKPFRKIYISRSGHNRNIENENEVIDYLSHHDFEIIFPEKETRNLQSLFNEAKIVIGVHGTNLSDSCVCQSGTNLIDILLPNHIYEFYMSVASANSLNYHSMICDTINNKYFANLDKLDKILDFIG